MENGIEPLIVTISLWPFTCTTRKLVKCSKTVETKLSMNTNTTFKEGFHNLALQKFLLMVSNWCMKTYLTLLKTITTYKPHIIGAIFERGTHNPLKTKFCLRGRTVQRTQWCCTYNINNTPFIMIRNLIATTGASGSPPAGFQRTYWSGHFVDFSALQRQSALGESNGGWGITKSVSSDEKVLHEQQWHK